MAIDNAEKRKSAATVCQVFSISSVTPNSSKDGEWRQQSAWGYSGITVLEVDDIARISGKMSLGLRIGLH